jgi:hypothetical protein
MQVNLHLIDVDPDDLRALGGAHALNIEKQDEAPLWLSQACDRAL